MSTSMRSDARLNFRLPSDLKKLIKQAADHLGQSVSEFAVSTLVRSAHAVIEQHHRTELSNRDRDIFLELLSDTDAAPNSALAAAAAAYKQEMD